MITDEELEQLSDEPEIAFIEIERLLRSSMDPSGNTNKQQAVDYMNNVLAAAEACGIADLKDYGTEKVTNDFFWETFADFSGNLDRCIMKLRIKNASRSKKYSVGLDGNTKQKIHFFINKIRQIIEQANLPADKHDELLKSLNAFEAEVDKMRTSLQAAADLWTTACEVIGDGFEKLKPMRDMLDSIGYLIHGAKKSEDEKRKALPPPPRRIEDLRNVSAASPDLDDDIPF